MSDERDFNTGFGWRGSLSGAVIGAGIAFLAWQWDESPWWWLAVLAGFCLGAASVNLNVSVKTRRK